MCKTISHPIHIDRLLLALQSLSAAVHPVVVVHEDIVLINVDDSVNSNAHVSTRNVRVLTKSGESLTSYALNVPDRALDSGRVGETL